jgi:hypothetical protein
MPNLTLEVAEGTALHGHIKTAVEERIKFSRNRMTDFHSKWRKAEELYKAYIKPTKEDEARAKKYEEGEPQYVTVIIPYSYAMLLTAHTYWSSVFLSRTPVFQYIGRHGESEQQVQAVEALIDYQVQVGEMLVPLYIWLLDVGKYGVGILGNYWAEEQSVIAEIVNEPVTVLGIPIPGKFKKVRRKTTIKGYEGNRIFNVRPYDFYPDPSVSLVNFQQGEFCGRRTPCGWNEFLERVETGKFFNAEAVEKSINVSEREQGSTTEELPYAPGWEAGTYGTGGTRRKGPLEMDELVLKLVPRDWKLGPSESPEKWVFTLANGKVVCGAEPLGMYHDRFPYFLQQYEVDGYSLSSRGMLEVAKPLNDVLSWLFNSHFYNVRKALNDQLVVDPSKINMKDLKEGGPGRIVRLNPSFYGTDVRTVLYQIPLVDVTTGHIRDSELVTKLLEIVLGVNANIMGQLAPGGRKTATEVRTSSSFGINRLKTFAEYSSALGWAPLAQVLLQNTQQLYEETKQFRIAGDLMGGRKFMSISPADIRGFYDFIPVDGTMPVDRFAQANLWKEILMGLAKMPQLAMQYDLGGIFGWMAQLAGLKNITQFKVQVTPDQVAMAQAAAGNIKPAGTSGGLGLPTPGSIPPAVAPTM